MEITRIQPLLRKKPWRRVINPDVEMHPMSDTQYYDIPTIEPIGVHCQYLGNAELLNESTEGARVINSNMYSTRPIYEIVEREIEVDDGNGGKEKKKIKEEVIVGYDRIENVRSGLGEMIAKQKASHLGQNGIEIADEGGKDHEGFDTFRSWKDVSGIDSAWVEALYHAGTCGDAALYIYQHGKSIEYSILAFALGDVLFPNKDDKGNDMLVRMYQLNGRTAVDIFMTDYIETWALGDIDDADKEKVNGAKSWWKVVKGWFRNISIKKSEDGWTRISRSRSQLDDYTCQVAYLRFNDIFIGPAMQNIEAFDRALSYTSDKMRSTAFSKLLVKATKIKNLPPLSSGEEVIGIDGDVESLKASDVKHVAPPDISNIATINLKNIFDAIMQTTMSIDLQPEILKSGADSSNTLKLLLRREIQWCHVMWPQVRPVAMKIIDILKKLVGKIEGDIERYDNLKISVWNTPWMPQDEAAQIDNVTKLVYAGVLSKENARHELRLQYTDDVRLVDKEQDDELYRKTYIPKKAEADAQKQFGLVETANDVIVDKEDDDNPDKKEKSPKVDNNASRRDIAEGK